MGGEAQPLCGRERGHHLEQRHGAVGRPRGSPRLCSPKALCPSQGEGLGFLQVKEKTGLEEWRRGRRYGQYEEKVMRKKNRRKETEGGSWVMRQDKEKGRKKSRREGDEQWKRQSKVKSQRGEKKAPILC